MRKNRQVEAHRIAKVDDSIEMKTFAKTLAKSHLLEGIQQVM